VIPLDVAMQFPEMAATLSNFFKAISKQFSTNAPATQSFSRAIGNVHCSFSFAAELVESKSRITLSLCRLTALLPAGAAWRRLIRR
jgi:hypothetical protein